MSGVPNVFGSATSSIPLSQLDVNFNTPVTIGNTTVGLGNTVTSFGNVTLTNTTISGLSGGSANGVVYINSSNVAVASPSVLTFDGTNLGIGTTSPAQKLHVYNNGAVAALQVQNNAYSSFLYTDGSGTQIGTNSATLPIYFYVGAAERARFDSSGNLLVGGTSPTGTPTQGFQVLMNSGQTNIEVGHINGTLSGTDFAGFSYNGSKIGSITQNGTTGVLYNLTSDYRLKNNQEDLTGAKDFIMALKPKKWQWWDGSGEGVGFVAHEFMEVAKYSGHGEKDAVDENGKPVYQSIQPSSSEVMANLVSLIQEQQALITQLQADVAALKGQA